MTVRSELKPLIRVKDYKQSILYLILAKAKKNIFIRKENLC